MSLRLLQLWGQTDGDNGNLFECLGRRNPSPYVLHQRAIHRGRSVGNVHLPQRQEIELELTALFGVRAFFIKKKLYGIEFFEFFEIRAKTSRLWEKPPAVWISSDLDLAFHPVLLLPRIPRDQVWLVKQVTNM